MNARSADPGRTVIGDIVGLAAHDADCRVDDCRAALGRDQQPVGVAADRADRGGSVAGDGVRLEVGDVDRSAARRIIGVQPDAVARVIGHGVSGERFDIERAARGLDVHAGRAVIACRVVREGRVDHVVPSFAVSSRKPSPDVARRGVPRDSHGQRAGRSC